MMDGEAVAWLEIGGAGVFPHGTHGTIEICGNEQFYLGRDAELCRYTWSDDLTISRQHLRVHCILYEQDPVASVAPLVYATDLSSNGTFLKSNTTHSASQEHGKLMGKHCTLLLNDGDELRMSDTVTLIYHSMLYKEGMEFTKIQEREKTAFASRYLVTGRLLGEGGYGKVLLGINQKTQQQLACKLVKLNHMYKRSKAPSLRICSMKRDQNESSQKKRWPTKVATCFREFDILKDISHPNIVALEKVFWSSSTIYIFQELVTGGDLFSFLEYNGGRLKATQAAVIIRQILKGIKHLHDLNIVHRDLKPDNILMTSLDDGARVVITDFGNARFLPNNHDAYAVETENNQRMFSYVGTLEFAAPEIHRANRAIPAQEGYSKSVDMWSIGSITATVLTGEFIFSNRAHPDYTKNPQAVIIGLAAICDLSILDEPYHPLWSRVGKRPKHFIKGLLVLDENERMTASEALAHPWFSNRSHANDYGDLYERSIQSWESRHGNEELIERIPRFSRDFVGRLLSQDSISYFFRPSQPGPTHDMLRKLSSSYHWRTNTPLPSIMDDYEQGRSPSSEIGRIKPEGQRRSNFYVQSRSNQEIFSAEKRNERQSPHCDTFNLNATNCPKKQHPPNSNSISYVLPENASDLGTFCGGLYHGEHSHDSGENLNEVKNDDIRRRDSVYVQPLIGRGVQGSIAFEETPPAAQNTAGYFSDDGRALDDFYQNAQLPEEVLSLQAGTQGTDSIIVLETPPDNFEQGPCFVDDEFLSYRDWSVDEAVTSSSDTAADSQPTERRKTPHTYP